MQLAKWESERLWEVHNNLMSKGVEFSFVESTNAFNLDSDVIII